MRDCSARDLLLATVGGLLCSHGLTAVGLALVGRIVTPSLNTACPMLPHACSTMLLETGGGGTVWVVDVLPGVGRTRSEGASR